MAKALVTGANGHLGGNLVRDLLERGYEVVPFVRAKADTAGLDGLELDYARGDVLDEASIARAFARCEGCEVVFHAAAPYLTWAKDPSTIVEPAVRGTENVLRAAKKANVRRVVVTSSCNAVGFTRDHEKPLDETTWNDSAKSPYIRSKNEQERRAWSLAKELDLDIVTVLPTAVLGRFDYRKTPTTAPFVDAFCGKGPVPFPMNLVDVRDVARAHVLAAEKGKRGERYLAGGDNIEIAALASLIEKHVGKRPAEGMPPAFVLRMVAFFAEVGSGISGKAPMITRALLDDVGSGVPLFDCRKAREELGLSPRPAEEVVIETLRWALYMGWIPEKIAGRVRDKYPADPSWPAKRAA